MKKFFIIISLFVIIVSITFGVAFTTSAPTVKTFFVPEAEETVPAITETTIPEPVEVEPTEPAVPALTFTPGIQQEQIIPVETTPIPTEPEETIPEITNPTTTHTFGEWTLISPATCFYRAVEMRECIECGKQEQRKIDGLLEENLITKTKVIDGMIVEYEACSHCDNLHDHYYMEVRKTRNIKSITVIDNDICRIVLVPQNERLTKWVCYFTNKTDERLETYGGLAPSFIEPGETEARTYYETIDNVLVATGKWGVPKNGEFAPDYRVYLNITITQKQMYG